MIQYDDTQAQNDWISVYEHEIHDVCTCSLLCLCGTLRPKSLMVPFVSKRGSKYIGYFI